MFKLFKSFDRPAYAALVQIVSEGCSSRSSCWTVCITQTRSSCKNLAAVQAVQVVQSFGKPNSFEWKSKLNASNVLNVLNKRSDRTSRTSEAIEHLEHLERAKRSNVSNTLNERSDRTFATNQQQIQLLIASIPWELKGAEPVPNL